MVYCVHPFIRPPIYLCVFLKTLLQYALVIYPVQTVSSIPAALEQTFLRQKNITKSRLTPGYATRSRKWMRRVQ